MRFNEHLLDDTIYHFECFDSNNNSVGTASVKTAQDKNGKFWHLDDLFVNKQFRSQGYGTALVKHLRNYIWNIDKLRIRVHPAIGEQGIEDSGEKYQSMQAQYSEEELDTFDKQVDQDLEKPGFFEKHKSIHDDTYTSEDLIKWYQKRGFSITDSDAKHLWCHS